MNYFLAIVAGFALGSIPFPVLLGKMQGADPRTVGTGNPGAANLFREISKPLGTLAAILDGGKGVLAVLVGGWLGLPEGATLLPGAAAIVGHWYPPITRFRGGQGLATAIGVGIGVLPLASAIGLAVGVVTTASWRNVGRGAGAGWTAFLGVSLGLENTWFVILGVLGLGIVLVVRDRLRSLLQQNAR